MRSNIRVGIISDRQYRSPRLLAEGLERMLKRLGIECELFLDGVELLRSPGTKRGPLNALRSMTSQRAIKGRLKKCTLFIVVWYTPSAFKDFFDISALRELGPDILQYSVYFLGGNRYWQDRLPEGSTGRYDGYLVASAIHECPVTSPRPVYPIGLDLVPHHPFVSKRENFLVLFDFPRDGFEEQREVQRAVVNDLGLASIELSGEYSFTEIEKVYQKASVSFVAFYEAFGVPVVQQQYYGSLVASPDPNWLKRHALLDNGSVTAGLTGAEFSSNFIFYEDYDDLKDRLSTASRTANPEQVRRTLLASHPHFVSGDLGALWNAICTHG